MFKNTKKKGNEKNKINIILTQESFNKEYRYMVSNFFYAGISRIFNLFMFVFIFLGYFETVKSDNKFNKGIKNNNKFSLGN